MNNENNKNIIFYCSLKSLVTIAGVALVLSSPIAQAENTPSDDANWGQWQALGDGYVARRRQPPNLDLPKSERRQENVQIRLKKLLERKQDLLANLEGQSSKDAVKIQKKIEKLEKQILKQTRVEQLLASKRSGSETDLWLHTGEEGLYSISISELAARLGKRERKLRNLLKRGLLVITTAEQLDSEATNRPVSWFYDQHSDSVVFAAESYETFYSDENAFKLSLGRKKSPLAWPMAVSDNVAASATGSEIDFRETLKFEEEPDYLFVTWVAPSEPDADFWLWDSLFGHYKDLISVNLNIPDPANTGTAQLRITLRGWTDMYPGNEHEVYAELNGTPVGSSVIWDGFKQAILVADFDQSILDASGNNTLNLRSRFAAGTTPGQALDQVEISYQRKPVALNGRLWMHNVETGTQTVSGLTSNDVFVVESPEGKAILREDVRFDPDGSGGWTASFDVSATSDFLVLERSALVEANVSMDNNASLKNSSNNADYLIIAPHDFNQTAESLASYRRSRFSNVSIVWLDDIYNEFAAGREDPAALARFLKYVVNEWGGGLENVLLLGKGSLDHKDRMGFADSFLPVIMTANPWALAASDSRLLGYEDTPPFSIGRLPIVSDIEGLAYIDKLKNYEASTPGEEKYKAVLVADNPDRAGDFHGNSNLLADHLLNSLGFDTVTKLYHPNVNVRASLIETATWESGFVNYDGHGSVTQAGDYREKFINSNDAGLLQNSAYPLFIALTCAAGDDTLPGTRSLAGSLVLNPNGGAIASVAPTGLSLDADAQIMGNSLVDNLFGVQSTIGMAVRDTKSEISGSISSFMPRMYSVIGEPGVSAR